MSDIKNLAEYYQNVHILDDNVKAVVMMENMEDKKFWDAKLQKCCPGNYFFVGHDNGLDVSASMPGGSTECMKYKDYLTDYFFLCIDSDMNQMLGVEGMTAANHIFQTYTYSWENHCCESGSLQTIMTSVCPKVASAFDFKVFLQHYSEAVYEPMLALLASAKAGRTEFTIRTFCSCIPKQCSKIDMDNNGLGLIKKIKENFNNAIPLSLKNSLDLEAAITTCNALMIDVSNAYLHTRGHDLYDLVRYIGWQLCKKEPVRFDVDILETNIASNCREMTLLENDLKQISA